MQIDILKWDEVKTRPVRQRTEVPTEHIRALAESISQNGLLHAPVVSNSLELIAGDCRRLAMKILINRGERITYNGESLPLEYIPVVKTDKTEEGELYRIELEENLRRKNLSQIEEAQAIARLHEFGKSNDPSWTNKQTAEQLVDFNQQTSVAYAETEVANSLLLAQFADDPEVRAAKTKVSAVRIAKRKMEQEFRALMGGEVKIISKHGVHHGDSLSILSTLSSGMFDGILTDPPYGIAADQFGSASFLGAAHQYSDSAEYAIECYNVLATQGFRVCAEDAALYSFCDIGLFPTLKEIFEEVGWQVWKTPLIWAKGTVGHSPLPEYGPKRSYEAILYARKGRKRIEKMGSDILSFSSVSSGDKLHAAEKPEALLAELISWSFLPGSRLLDPFAGSGSLFSPAHKAGMFVTGIELDETNAAIIRDRISRL